MSDVVIRTPMQYLDRALTTLRDLGIVPGKAEDAPINALLQKITDLDAERVTVIARTLNQAANFNEIVREHVAGMEVGDRYRQITEGFNSIRDDARAMVDQISDGKVSVWLSGNQLPLKVRVDPALLSEGQTTVETAMLEALKSAYELSTSTMKERMDTLTGGLELNLPGLGG